MFAPYCPRHRSRVLLGNSDIVALRNTPVGIEVHFRCFCGHRGVWLTGRRRRSGTLRAAAGG